MFEHLPKLTQGDLEFMRDVLVGKLIERPAGVDDFEEAWTRICEGLSDEYCWALRAGANMVAETWATETVEDPEVIKIGINWAVGVAQLALLALIDRRVEADELQKRLGL